MTSSSNQSKIQEKIPFNPNIQTFSNINNFQFNKQDSLKLLYLNACSIYNKIGDLNYILNTLDSPIHLIAISETWIQQNNSISVQNYKTVVSNRINKSGGGVCLLIHDSITNFECVDKFSDDRLSMLTVKLYLRGEEFVISVFYNPPNMNSYTANNFLKFFDDKLDKFSNKNVIVIGDFNLNLIGDSVVIRNYKNIIKLNNFYVCDSNTPTRSISGTVLDHVMVNNVNQKISISHTSVDFTDHNLILCEFESLKLSKHTQNDSITTKKINFEHLNNLIESDMHINGDSANEMCNNFIDSLKRCIRQSCKTKVIKLKKNSTQLKPWMDGELLNLSKVKYYWYLKLKKAISLAKSPVIIESIKDEHKMWKNKYSSLKSRKKKQFYTEKFEKALHNNRNTWKAINCVLHDGVVKKREILNLKVNESLITDNLKVANVFNAHFCEVGKSMTDKFVDQEFVDEFPPIDIEHPFVFGSTTAAEVKSIIMRLNNTKSMGVDNISVETVKKCADALSPLLSAIINKSFEEGIFPDILKIVKTIPIFKKGSKLDANNFRPIALMSVISKIFEMAFKRRLLLFITENNLLCNKQYGFRENSNTSAALFDIVSYIQMELEKKNKVAAIFLDLKKAFDSVDIEILVFKLKKLGICHLAQKWILSYLSKRIQRVQIDEQFSSDLEINIGVPQGSILGPLLFLLFINDIKSLQCQGNFFLYADDIALVCNGQDNSSLQNSMNEDMHLIKSWIKNNKLILNVEKTKVMIFKNRDISLIKVVFDGMPIENVNTFKYLGFVLDSQLNFKQHVATLFSKLSSIAGVFRRVGPHIHQHLKRQLFYAFFHSNTLYGIILWGSSNKTTITKLQTVQNRAIKNLFELHRRSHTVEIHITNRILPIFQMVTLKMNINTHNILNKYVHTNTSFCVNSGVHNHFTRSCSDLHFNSSYKNSLNYISIQFYNKVQNTFKILDKSHFFKLLKNETIRDFVNS